MTNFALSLKIEQVGADRTLGEITSLTKAGQVVVERFSKATGVALDQAIAKWKQLGDKAAETMLREAVSAESSARRQVAALNETAAAHDRVDRAVRHGSEGHELHIHGLSRIGNSLASLVGHATGVPPVLERIGDAMAIMAFGHLATVGVLAGFAAVSFAYEKITTKAREAAEQAEKTAERIRSAAAKAANAGQADDLNSLAREAYFGTPYVGDGKDRHIVASSDLVKGAFSGSLADLKAQRELLLQQIQEAPNLIRKSKLARDLMKLETALKPLQENFDAIVTARDNLLGQPADNVGKLPGVTTTALSPAAEARLAQRAWDRAVKAFADGVERRQKAFDQAVQSEIARLTNADDPTLSTNDRLERANRRMDAADGGPLGLPDVKEIREQIKAMMSADHFQLGETISEQIKNDPFLKNQAASEKMGKELGSMLGNGLGRGLEQGFAAAFSGKGIEGFIKGFGDTMLKALGEIFIRQGEALIDFSVIMKGLGFALANPLTAPWAAAAEGAALIALGAALAAIGGGGSSGGYGGGGSYSGGSGLPQIIDRGIIDPSAYSGAAASSIAARPSVTNNVTIIGPNDPQAQRAWDELQRKSQQRGSLAA